MSTAEREAAELAAIAPFKARPLDARVLHSTGDLGVPRVEKAALTQVRCYGGWMWVDAGECGWMWVCAWMRV